MSNGEKISIRRKELGLTLEQVGDFVGVSKSTVRKWETGYIANMRRDKIAKLAKILQLNPSELINPEAIPEPSNIASIEEHNVYCVPVFESVAAGFGTHASSDVLGYIPVIIRNPYDVPNTLSIRVQGDSMYPKIENGDLIVVRKQDCLESGEIGVVMLDGEDGLVKRVVYGDDRIELQSINPEYAPRRFEGEEILRLKIVGKVVGIYKEP